MNRKLLRVGLYALLGIVFLLRYDFWLWNDARLVAGLPIGLTYHVLVCLVAAALMGLLASYAWPARLDREGEDGP